MSEHEIKDEDLDEVLGKKWKGNTFMYGKMFDFKQDIIGQLGSGHLRYLRQIIEKRKAQ